METATHKQRFVKVLAALAETFQREVTTAMFEGYWVGLSDIPIDDLEASVTTAIRTSKFMPTPAELRSFAMGDSGSTHEDRGMVAFAAVVNAVERLGAYKSVNFDDPLVNAAINTMGGWQHVCELPESEFNSHFRREFIRQYAAFSRTGVNGEVTRPLIGISDQQNLLNGYEGSKPILIPCGTGRKDVRLIDGSPRHGQQPKLIGHSYSAGRKVGEPKSLREILGERDLAGD